MSSLTNSLEGAYAACDSDHADSIGTHSIASSVSSCKSISDPTVLFAKAIGDLRLAAQQLTAQDGGEEEYWSVWSYWKKHPFVTQNTALSGQLLLEQY